ncbi:sulfide:quinone oxidoreductase [Solirubrobacter pauli]|uniref:Sulfide:quinone oxidoreductase n=1 Tax=Solirubrobacter pauli TaxID=166793 RepID=A0A660L1A8_9ACTN|nr:sulfide:quinone oxidoreductase [Solirubrobacter pauli]
MPAAPHIVVVGGGIAAVEFILALDEAAGTRVRTTLVAPDEELLVRPTLVAAPSQHFPLQTIADDIGFTFVRAALDAVEPRRIRLRGGGTLEYDTLVLAPGARRLPAFDDALQLPDELHVLHEEIDRGAVTDVAFVVPTLRGWVLPAYEAALLTGHRHPDLAITLVSPEPTPLAMFGLEASVQVAAALDRVGVHRTAELPEGARVVALPLLRGPEISGVPRTGLYGLIPVDEHLRVRGLQRVYALGDATDFPLKHGGIACQQADAAAAHIAAPLTAAPFTPRLEAILLTGEEPIVLGGAPAKVPGRLLAPYLETAAARSSISDTSRMAPRSADVAMAAYARRAGDTTRSRPTGE